MDIRIKSIIKRAFRLGDVAKLSSFSGSCSPTDQIDKVTSNIQKSIPYFRGIHNIHRGRRGFVIGNGPSLSLTDLDLLIGEITISSNKVYLAFDQVKWRPTYYTVADPLVWDKVKNGIPSSIEKVHIPSYLDPYEGISCEVWRSLGLAGDRQASTVDKSVIDFSPDATRGLFGSCTITFENLQLAVHLGLDPIYIIGCDHYYKGEEEIKRDQPIKHGVVSNHFIDGYRVSGEQVNPAPIEIMNRGYLEARKFSDECGVRIINATRGGHLDIFERENFESVIQSIH